MRLRVRARVGEDRSGGLRKRAPRLSRSCAVHPWVGFRHLRFAAPARAVPAHGPPPAARGLGQSHPSALRRPERLATWLLAAVALKMLGPGSAYVPPNLRTGLPRPPEQSTPIAVRLFPEQRLVVAEKRTRRGEGPVE